jgi:hypothetical protein
LIIKRPGDGVAPGDVDKIIGRRVTDELAQVAVITWEMFRLWRALMPL